MSFLCSKRFNATGLLTVNPEHLPCRSGSSALRGQPPDPQAKLHLYGSSFISIFKPSCSGSFGSKHICSLRLECSLDIHVACYFTSFLFSICSHTPCQLVVPTLSSLSFPVPSWFCFPYSTSLLIFLLWHWWPSDILHILSGQLLPSFLAEI